MGGGGGGGGGERFIKDHKREANPLSREGKKLGRRKAIIGKEHHYRVLSLSPKRSNQALRPTAPLSPRRINTKSDHQG